MKKILALISILSVISCSPAEAATQSIPKDPRTHIAINSNLITFNNKLNEISLNSYVFKYSIKSTQSLYKAAWDRARKNGVVIKPKLTDSQVADGLKSDSYGIYEFIDVSMKAIPKIKYCLMSSKYEATAVYRSEFWMVVNLYAQDCTSLMGYYFAKPGSEAPFTPDSVTAASTTKIDTVSTPHLKAGVVPYTVGTNASEGVYVIRQNDDFLSYCSYGLTTAIDVGNGVVQLRKYTGTLREGETTYNDTSAGILTIRVKNGDTFWPFCDAELYTGGIPDIFNWGTYLVGVNITPGTFQSKGKSCSYTYSTPQTPINMNLIYGNNLHPTYFSGSAGQIVIPNNANAVYFGPNCTSLIKISS